MAIEQARSDSLPNLRQAFVQPPPGRFPQYLTDGPGLSFAHSGLSNAATMARLVVEGDEWTEASETAVRQVRLRDPQTDLTVVLEYTYYPRHHAVVYGATLTNDGWLPIAHLTNLLSSDWTFGPIDPIGSPTVHTIGGGVTHYHYPPQAFRLQAEHLLGPTLFTIDSGPSGRSSNKDLPFFFIEDDDHTSGLFAGIEWSGLWSYRFQRRDEPGQVHYGRLGHNKSLQVTGGMDEVDLVLYPGESFSCPRVLIGFYEGTIEDGRNRLRRFLGDWAPKLGDGTWTPFIQATPGGYVCPPSLTNHAQCVTHARANAEIGVEYYVIECWFKDLPVSGDMGATHLTRGSWWPEESRFPNMKRTADEVRATGLRFGLWTDMEVAHAASEVAQQHPDWVLYLPPAEGEAPSPTGLLNLAVPAAQDWAIATYDRLIAEYDLEWIFYDNNINPAPYWAANEPAHRKGRLQHDYIRGFWRVWDEVRRRHPHVVLENCSSGGRRIDLGTIGRAHCNFSSDQFRHVDSIRYQFSGANTVLPGDRVMSFICLGQDDYSDTDLLTFFGGQICITEGVEDWTPELRKKVRRHFEVFKSIRHLLSKDYYMLCPQPSTIREWEGWQFHDPTSGEGVILAFRGRAPEERRQIQLRGLDRAATYVLTDPFRDVETVASGERLTSDGLLFEIEPGGSRLLRYRVR